MSPSRIPRPTPHPKPRDGTKQPTRSAKLNKDLAECLNNALFLPPPQPSESGSVHRSEDSSSVHVLSSIKLTSFPGSAIGLMSSDPELGVMKLEDINLSSVSAKFKVSNENSDVNDSENREQEFSNLKNGTPRLIQDDNGNGPFSKPHIVTKFPKAPFSGSHTAIAITDGPDRGKWLHIARKLSKEEAVFAMTEMFWVWNVRDNITTGDEANCGSPASKELAAQLYKSIDKSNWKLLGPPGAQFPLTTSIDAPFAGPRTVVLNCGIFFNSWHLHIPRLLSAKQIAIAQSNLGELCMNRWEWGSDNEADSGSALNKKMAETMAFSKVMQNQKKIADFLENDLGFDFSTQDVNHAEMSDEEAVWVKRSLKYFVHPAFLPQQPSFLRYKTYEEIELNFDHSKELGTVSQTQSDHTLSIVGPVSRSTPSLREAAGDNQICASSSISHGDLQLYNGFESPKLHSSTLNIQGSVLGFTPSLSETDNANELAAFLEPKVGTTEQTYGEINVDVRLSSSSLTSPELRLGSLRSVSKSTLSLSESNDERGLIVSYSARNAVLNTDRIEVKRESLFTALELPGRSDGGLDVPVVEVIDSHKPNRRGTFPPLDTESSRHLGVEVDLPDDVDLDGDTLNSNAGTIFPKPDCSAQRPVEFRYLKEDLEQRGDVKNAPELVLPSIEASGCCVGKSSITEVPELALEPYLSRLETPLRYDNVELSITEDQRLRAAYENHTITSDPHDQLSTAGTNRHVSTTTDILDAEIQDISDERKVLLLEIVLLLEDIAQDLNARHKKVGPALKLCNLDSCQQTAVEEQGIVGPVESSARLQILLGILPWFLYLSLGFYKNVL